MPSMYEWTELLSLWKQERITVEQAIGQLLLRQHETEKKVASFAQELRELKREPQAWEERFELMKGYKKVAEMVDYQLELDTIKLEHAKLDQRIERLWQQVEALVKREKRRGSL